MSSELVKKYNILALMTAVYLLSACAIYRILPPIFSVEIALAPSKYMHIEEDPVTGSRVASIIFLKPFDETRSELESLYLKCGNSRRSNARVIAISQDAKTFRFAVQDTVGEISRQQVDCAVEAMIEEQDILWRLLVLHRKLVPPANFENSKLSLIDIKNQTEQAKFKLIIRAAVLGLVFVLLVYSLWMTFLRVRQQKNIDLDA